MKEKNECDYQWTANDCDNNCCQHRMDTHRRHSVNDYRFILQSPKKDTAVHGWIAKLVKSLWALVGKAQCLASFSSLFCVGRLDKDSWIA